MIINLDSQTHPQARIKGVDLERGRVDFVWVNGPHNGDCSVDWPVTAENFMDDCIAAVSSLITPQ